MRKMYFSNRFGRRLSKAMAICASLAMMGAASAQLSGNYTIDKNLPASSTNFVSFGSFATAINTNGVSGPVTVRVFNGPYTEQVAFNAISGVSATNTVTIKGNLQKLTHSATGSSSKHTLMLNGTDRFIIDSLHVEAAGSYFGYGIYLQGQADYNTIRNCIVDVPNVDNNNRYYFSQSYVDGAANIVIAAAQNSIALYYYYGYGAFGNNGRYNTITNNTLNGGKTGVTGPMYGIYEAGQYNFPANYRTNNIISNNKINNFYLCGIVSNFTDGSQIIGNELYRNTTAVGQTYAEVYGVFAYYCNSQDQSHRIENNYIHDLSGTTNPNNYSYPAYVYGIYDFYPYGTGTNKAQCNRNRIVNNKCGGYFYGLYSYYFQNGEVNNNVLSNNTATYGLYNMFFYYPSNSIMAHNTIWCDAVSGYNPSFTYGLYAYHYTTSNSDIIGNISAINLTSGTSYALYLGASETYWKSVDYNDFWARNNSTNPIVINGSGMNITNFNNQTGWRNNLSATPKLANPAGNDYRTLAFRLNNKVPTRIPRDLGNNLRNAFRTDIGAVEVFTDLKTDSFPLGAPSTVCGGYSVRPRVVFTNNFVDTAEQIPVSVRVGTGQMLTEIITAKVPPGKSYSYTFTKAVEFHNPGNNLVWGGVNIPDDNLLNDTLKTIIFVKPSPDGGSYTASTKPTKAIYQLSRPFDVTIVNEPIIYTMNAPTDFTNGGYNTTWNATSWATTAGGVMRPLSEVTTTNPSGSNNYEVQWKTSDLAIEDTTIWIYTRVTDLGNGCDTTIRRQVLLYPKIRPSFSVASKICDGDAIFFDNTSTVRSGGMEFKWQFNVGMTNDTSDATSPVFQYPTSGNYIVRVVGKTIPYGFESVLLDTIEVNPIPTVAFVKQNACEGLPINFINNTTPATGTTYTWEFGDGSPNATSRNTNHKYAQPGKYVVKLTANLNGCITSQTANVYQFPKPIANYNVIGGSCDNAPFSFGNSSTILSGEWGSYWDFDDNNNVSTEDNPNYDFNSAGVKNVTLYVTSEFGCKDTVVKTVIVKEAPVATFSNTPACSLTPTDFTNTTGDVSGTSASYNWNFGDGNVSTAKSPTHSWTTLGPKTVTLKVTLNNGCSDQTSKELSVGVQPRAAFEAQNVCAGQPVLFENNTTWPQGQISYDWNFGDGGISSSSDPTYLYNVTNTTTYNVTLTAKVAGGCEDVVTKQVTINEAPRTCDFDFEIRYDRGFRGIVFKPKTGSGAYQAQSGVTYTWIYDKEGNETITGDGTSNENKFGFVDLQTDGSYKITMRAKVGSTGCECEVTKTVTMNRTQAEELKKNGVSVYPNPNNGQFNIAVTEAFGKEVKVLITNSVGAVVKEVNAVNENGAISINASELSSGVYMVKVVSGNNAASAKITVQ